MRQPKNFQPTPFEYHQQLELEIETLTNLGCGLGRYELEEGQKWVIMVPFTLPGEKVRVKIWRNKANYSDADLVEIIDASPDRVDPQCPLFGECGGCQYQHYSYEQQKEWKRKQVVELLDKNGGIDFEVLPTYESPEQYAYRSKITPHFQRVRGEETPIGFQRAATRSIIDVAQCPIATDAINAAMPAARDEIKSGKRKFKRGGTLLLRDTQEGVITDNNAMATERVGNLVFQFQVGEFFQNNPYILPGMINYAVEHAKGEDVTHLVDAYCGVGVFALTAAKHFEEVAGVEISGKAIQMAKVNAQMNGIENCSFIASSAEGIFEEIEFDPAKTAMIIDPPRKGCDEVFLNQLFAFGPKRVVYVSCGPDTQARDLKIFLENAYKLVEVQPFDLFPQTRHIENVAVLEKVC